MPQFLNHQIIKKELLNLFYTADECIFLVSPYIKLNDEMRKALSRKRNDPKFEIVVLFGKNEENLSKSLSREDMEFFKDFANVEICYHADLHAKYYGNEIKSIVTSLNLHQYSVKNNIEIGILLERKMFDFGGDKKLDTEIFEYIEKVLESSELVYEKRTKQERFLFGLIGGKTNKKVSYDATSQIYGSPLTPNMYPNSQKMGYCIRTGKEIPFNIKVPYSKEAHQSWAVFKNENYKEQYCHYSGEKSNGETSFSRPVLKKYFKEAMSLQNK
jgi:hypothetical protein